MTSIFPCDSWLLCGPQSLGTVALGLQGVFLPPFPLPSAESPKAGRLIGVFSGTERCLGGDSDMWPGRGSEELVVAVQDAQGGSLAPRAPSAFAVAPASGRGLSGQRLENFPFSSVQERGAVSATSKHPSGSGGGLRS